MMRTVAIGLMAIAAAAPPLIAQSTLRIEGTTAAIERVQGQRLVSAAALAPLDARVLPDGWRARLLIMGDTIHFAGHSPFLRVRSRTDQLVSPAILEGTTLWLPVQFFTEWLPQTYPTRLTYRDGVLARNAVAARGPSSPARDSGKRIDSVSSPRPERARPTRVVVLDPGHGGRDPGKPGPNGLLEKNAALAVTNRLAGFLRERGYEVHLTRSRDTLISLDDRPHFANTWKNGRPAAVFISIHANSGVRGATGFETYFLSTARTDDERRVAEMENAAVQYEDRKSSDATPELDLIISGLRNDFYQRASNSLAELIQSSMATVHPGPNRGVKQAGFRVLIGAVMPAVLVEMGFISDSREARLLGTATFQQKIAWSLAQAVDRFFQLHEPLFTSATSQ
jgi:N-acetylmuramoyl-L-alanine amidase